MNKTLNRLNKLIGMVVLLALLISTAHAHTLAAGDTPLAAFAVNSTVDAVDAAPGNGVCATAGSVCTLRAAIQEANALAGDDTIIVPSGTYTLTLAGINENAAATGDLDVTSHITLTGAGAATTIINGGWIDRALHVTGAFTVNLSGLTITHGNGSGGGLRNDGGVVTITDSAISDNNSGTAAGGILNSGTLALVHSTIFDNNAGTDAGGISSSGVLTITTSTFDSNNAGDDAGGISSSGVLTITNSAFTNNNAGADGGGIFSSGNVKIANSTFYTNNASSGGGIYSSSGVVTATTSAFSGNTAWTGGGIYDGGSVITVTHSTFAENSATSGGGLFTQFDVTIANSTFSDNSASDGDDTYTVSGTLTVINSTIFGQIPDPDRAADRADHRPAGTGGGVYNSGGTVTLRNTIVASHDSGGNCVGVITNGGHNLDDGTSCGWASINGSLSNINPWLGTLTGSPAHFPLNPASTAIDAGDNAACAAVPVNNTSQNGVTRPIDGDGNGTATCDMGAFESAKGFRVYLPYSVK